jgi:hypothetical protein
MAERPVRRNRAVLRVVELALAAGVLVWLASRIDLARFLESIRGASLPILGASVACVVAPGPAALQPMRMIFAIEGTPTSLSTNSM